MARLLDNRRNVVKKASPELGVDTQATVESATVKFSASTVELAYLVGEHCLHRDYQAVQRLIAGCLYTPFASIRRQHQ